MGRGGFLFWVWGEAGGKWKKALREIGSFGEEMDEGIVLQNEHLQDWLVSRLKEGDFEGDSEALAKYILALLETYALDSTDEKANFASNKTIRGEKEGYPLVC